MGGKTQKQTTVQDTTQQQTQNQFLQSLQALFEGSSTTSNQQQNQTATGSSTGTTTGTSQATSTGTNAQQQQSQAVQQQQQTGTGTSTTSSNLYAGQQPNVDLLLAGARDAYAAGNTDPLQMQARQAATGYATGVGSDLVGSAINADRSLLDTNRIFDVQNNQQYQTLAGDVTSRVNKNLLETILPQVRAGAISTGNLGGSGEGLVTGKAIGDTSAGLASALAGLQSDIIGQNANLYTGAQSRVGTNYNLGLAPSNTLESVGASNVGDRNAALQLLQSLTGQYGTYGGTTTGTNTQTGQTTGTSQQTGTSTGTATEASTAAQQQQTQQQSQQASQTDIASQVDQLLQRLGLTDTVGQTDATGSSHTTGTNTTKSGGGLFNQLLGGALTLLPMLF